MGRPSIYPPETREIPFGQWISFLAEFTRENRGADARLEIIGSEDEPFYQVETEGRPLDGVSADIKDRERTVWIAFGWPAEERLTHGVHRAKAIRLLPATQSAGPILEVEANDGVKTILELGRLKTHALPPEENR